MKTTVRNITKLWRGGIAVTIDERSNSLVKVSMAGMIDGSIHFEEFYALAQDVRSHMLERNKK